MLVDFVAKFTPEPRVPVGICQVMVKKQQMYVDSVSNIRGSRIMVVMISPEWLQLEKSLRLGFCSSNNKVEYGALIDDLKVVQKLSAEEVEVFSNSKLVLSQIEGSFETKDPVCSNT